MRLFQAYVMVDWSAATKPATGPDSIWIGVLKRNVRFQLAFESHNPPTRVDAEKTLEAVLGDLRRKSERVLVGFDFPLAFPRGTAAALKLGGPPWRALMDFVAAEVKDKPNNANNRFQVGAKMNRLMTGEAFPFWGAPARDEQTMLSAKRTREHTERDLPEFRLAEAAIKGPSSIWKLYYQGSVGGQALTGLPVIKRLKDARGERARIWPFETGWKPLAASELDGVDAVFAEIYPSMFGAKAGPGVVKDEAQVRAACERFAALDEKSQLGPLFGPAKDDPRRDVVEREEGWILGASA
ncbi:cobalamin biosynthesis protein CbiG [Terricaulis sp.]|uniref:cobalamin biosynthesis protein CbiG n=1 Tax=Terricaulis sp. TaxID=2768686 RepID=UPI003783CAC2